MTPITALGSRYGIQGALGRSVKRAAAGGGWWDLNGTITSCVAAYQPKGAASYAASLTDLSGNGNTLTEFSGTPGWTSGGGWTFARYLNTLITPTINLTNPSVIIRYSDIQANTNGNYGYLVGYEVYPRFIIRATLNGEHIYGYQTTNVNVTGNLSTGVCALTKDAGYVDGVKDADINKSVENYNYTWGIGGNSTNGYGIAGKVQAVAFYNNYTLSLSEVQSLTTAMNAL